MITLPEAQHILASAHRDAGAPSPHAQEVEDFHSLVADLDLPLTQRLASDAARRARPRYTRTTRKEVTTYGA